MYRAPSPCGGGTPSPWGARAHLLGELSIALPDELVQGTLWTVVLKIGPPLILSSFCFGALGFCVFAMGGKMVKNISHPCVRFLDWKI